MVSPKEEEAAVQQFLHAFNFAGRVDVETVRRGLFSQRQFNDLGTARDYVDQFIKKCERRDSNAIKPLKKRVEVVMNESNQMTFMMEFLVRCRQTHLFQSPPSGTNSVAGTSSTTPSVQSSPFQRRSASRTRVLSTLTGEPTLVNESTRSRANSSFTSYDSRMIGMERQRPKSPFRLAGNQIGTGIPTTRVSPLTASNHLFSASNGYTPTISSLATTPGSATMRQRDESPSYLPHRTTPTHHLNGSATASIRAPITAKSATPLHSRIGSAMTHTESYVCDCLLAALLGIETRLFTPIHRKMSINSTASLSGNHMSVAHRVLRVADTYMLLAHKDASSTHGTVSAALLASIRFILGDYIADIDGLRRKKNVKFHEILPVVDTWSTHLNLLAMAHKLRNIAQLDLLEYLYVLHRSYCHDEERKAILDKVLDYTMGVFCTQIMDWMTTGEPPAEKFQWMIQKELQTGNVVLKKVPVFISDVDAQILLEIGKSLPRVESASDEDLAAIDKATTVVRAALSPQLIFRKELTPLLVILRDVVCGIVMRMVLTTGRLKEHVQKATSFFFLTDPRFTTTLYTIIKEASLGLRVGSASLSRQTVSSALASALEATTTQSAAEKKKNKLKFTLDALTSLGSTPNVSSKMQFVQPLRPKYEPTMDLMKPIFNACDDDYESIFHVIWAIDLARVSSQESAAHLPSMMRFLVKNYSLRENAWCLLDMLSHVFFVVNSSLSRIRSIITMQLQHHLARFLAAIDEKCVDVDDVVREHQTFVRRCLVSVYARGNEKTEHELANMLRVAFEAQELAGDLSGAWDDVIATTAADENVRKAKMAEMCQKRVLGIRMLLETVNKSQKKLMELLDLQVAFGNDALLD